MDIGERIEFEDYGRGLETGTLVDRGRSAISGRPIWLVEPVDFQPFRAPPHGHRWIDELCITLALRMLGKNGTVSCPDCARFTPNPNSPGGLGKCESRGAHWPKRGVWCVFYEAREG